MANNNHVTLIGNLTADPKTHDSKTLQICGLRLAVTGREKTQDGWQNRPNYFDITCFAGTADTAGKLSKGEKIQVEGRLRWREWQTADGASRQAVEIIAGTIETVAVPAPAEAEQEVAA